MAAATVASGPTFNVIGNRRRVSARLTAPANNDTWVVPGLQYIEDVEISFPGGDLAATDSVSHTVSGATITFKVVGTARDLRVIAVGV